MKFRHAKKLHKGDEVTVKKTGEILPVTYTEIDDKNVNVFISGYGMISHKQIL